LLQTGFNARRHADAEPRARKGALAISGSTAPVPFENLREKLIAIAEFRHGLSRAEADVAYGNAVAAFRLTTGEVSADASSLQPFLRTFHGCCAELGVGPRPETGANRLSAILSREDARRVLRSLARITPESHRTFRLLLGRKVDRER
jgi:hypothetical protein